MKIHALITTAVLCLTLRAFAADPGAGASSSTYDFSHPVSGDPYEEESFDDTYQFLFFATLEGLYRDGVSSADAGALSNLRNFVYTCPICMPVRGAIDTYKLRPDIAHLKTGSYQNHESTLGTGLPPEVSAALQSGNPEVRLKAVNALVSKWVAYRMDHAGLTDDEKKALLAELKKRREEGMKAMGGNTSPGYIKGDECAICNGALQMPLKLKIPAPEK